MPVSEKMILWFDEWLLAVNKPAGLPTLPDGYHPDAPYLQGILSVEYGRLWVVHRLDRETSGVLVLARSAEAHRALNTQFDQRKVSKVYHALAVGAPSWEEQTVSLPLRVNVGHRHRTAIDARRGKPSVTHFKILERFRCPVPSGKSQSPSQFLLIEARPETGRTHQIRAHLAAAGCPILGDHLYGEVLQMKPGIKDGQPNPHTLLERLGLHARSLDLFHPTSGEKMHFEAPYPKDFESALQQLRKNCTLAS
jgi:RluA family pseudouridine synthase